jgi:hypothetical protein
MVFETLGFEICSDGTASSARKMLNVPASVACNTSEEDVVSVVYEFGRNRSDWVNAAVLFTQLLFLTGCFLL